MQNIKKTFKTIVIIVGLTSFLPAFGMENNAYPMEPTQLTSDFMQPNQLTSDFQIYQLLSTTQNNPDFYLPQELIEVITIKSREIICCATYNYCIQNSGSLVDFIEEAADSKDIELTTYIVKTCLNYSGKSLCDGKGELSGNPLQLTLYRCILAEDAGDTAERRYFQKCCIDVLCQLTGNELMNLLNTKNYNERIALTHTLSAIRKDLVNFNNRIDERTLKIDLLDWEDTPHYIKVLLNYLDEDQTVQLFSNSVKQT